MFPAREKVYIGAKNSSNFSIVKCRFFVWHCTNYIEYFSSTQWTAFDWKTIFPKKDKLRSCCTQDLSYKIQIIQSSPLLNLFPKMVTLRNKRKLAAVSREVQEYARSSQSQNLSAPGISEEDIAQVSEEIEKSY